jgi:hypothetical protein
MTIGGSVMALCLLPVAIIMGWDHSFEPAALCWAALTLFSLSVSAFGCFTLRFEAVESANKTLQATAAVPGS